MVDFECKTFYGYEDFLEILRLLRSPGGCPWDRKQTHQSLRRNFLEETYEALDALDRDHAQDLCEELGDVFLQVVFHATIEEERGRFTMADVVNRVAQKMVYRHPHVFRSGSEQDGDEALMNWEELKRSEKGFPSAADEIEAVPHTLPSLWRAEKIHKKAARAGFDRADPAEVLSRLEAEVAALRQALESDQPAPHEVREALGDTLLTAAKIAQMTGVDPEDALHRACDQFGAHVRKREEAADGSLADPEAAALDALRERAKEEQHS